MKDILTLQVKWRNKASIVVQILHFNIIIYVKFYFLKKNAEPAVYYFAKCGKSFLNVLHPHNSDFRRCIPGHLYMLNFIFKVYFTGFFKTKGFIKFF